MRQFAAAGLVLASLILCAAPLQADLPTGQRVQDRLRQTATSPDRLVELSAGGTGFIAIHRAGQRDPLRGGVVLLHDHQTNADSPEAIRPLRLGLAAAGWDTLSLQLRVAARGNAPGTGKGASDISAARLEAGLDWLRARGITDLVILAQGSRAQVALEWITSARPQGVQALILLSSTLALTPEEADLDPWQERFDQIMVDPQFIERLGIAGYSDDYGVATGEDIAEIVQGVKSEALTA